MEKKSKIKVDPYNSPILTDDTVNIGGMLPSTTWRQGYDKYNASYPGLSIDEYKYGVEQAALGNFNTSYGHEVSKLPASKRHFVPGAYTYKPFNPPNKLDDSEVNSTTSFLDYLTGTNPVQSSVTANSGYGLSNNGYNYGTSLLGDVKQGLGSIGNSIMGIIGTSGFNKDGTYYSTGLGGIKGIADLGAGLASLYSIYNGIQANKRAEDAWKMQKAEYNRGVQKDKDFAAAINRSGLGTYSAGV